MRIPISGDAAESWGRLRGHRRPRYGESFSQIPLEDQDSRDLLWIRYEFIHSSCDFGKTVVFGHTPTSHAEPLFLPGRIGIDTGAVYGGPLTCVELPTQRVYQA